MKRFSVGGTLGRARLVATSAVRDASNGEEFLKAASEVSSVNCLVQCCD